MRFMKSIHVATAVVGAVTAPKDLDVKSPSSIRNVASSIAFDAMSYYKGNTSAPNSINVGDLEDPYYWWVAGALWGAMLDYYHFTKDPSYNDVVIQALLAPTNLGVQHSYMPPEHAFEEGNDDLFFWAAAVLSAAERNFPQPDRSIPSWLEIGAKVFDELAGRWNDQQCGGGLYWQIYASNPNGMRYKNSVSNGGFFQLAARMARATGNNTYLEWAERVWDWSMDVGFVDAQTYHVWDGADVAENCTKTNPLTFTYTTGIYLYGAAVMANHTKNPEWARRAERLLDGAAWFFTPPRDDETKAINNTNVMYEAACETVDRCNADMSTFKGYLSRFMWQSTLMVPSLRAKVEAYLVPSALAAAATCTGGKNGRACGMKWYVGGYDGNPGLGQEMCALETIQGLLVGESEPPLRAGDIRTVRDVDWTAGQHPSTVTSQPAKTTKRDGSGEGARPTKKSDGAPSRGLDGRSSWAVVVVAIAAVALASWMI